MNNKLFKYIGIVAVALILLLIIGKKAGWIGGKDLTQVSTAKVGRRTISETVSASGKVQPEVEVKISPDVSGEIVEMYVKEGDQVKKGQLLARINPIIYASASDRMMAALNTAKANLANAKARLVQSESQFNKAELTYKRNKKLAEDGAISASDLEAAQSAYEVAKADVDASRQNVVGSQYNVQSSEASLKESKDNLNKTSIFSPVDGTISKLNVEKGERVVGTSQMAGTEMMRIANLNEMEVTVDVNENDIIRLHMNDTALIAVDSYVDRKFKGIVTEIGNSANTVGSSVDQVTNFPVKIRVLRESYQDLIPADKPNQSPFRPGMSATVDIQTKRVVNVLAIGIQAVTTRDSSAKKTMTSKDEPATGKQEESAKEKDTKVSECVFVLKDGKVKQVAITTGVQDNTYIEVKTGLKEGDEVVVAPYSAISKKLKDGDAVKVVPKEDLFNKEDK